MIPNLACGPRRENRGRWKLAVAVLSLLLLPLAGCTDKQLKQASVTIRDFAVALESFQNAEIAAHSSGFIADADHLAIQGAIERIATYGQSAVQAIRVAKSKPQAIDAIDAALAETDKLLNQGLLAVKNEQSKAAISALVLTVRGVLVTTKALLSQ